MAAVDMGSEGVEEEREVVMVAVVMVMVLASGSMEACTATTTTTTTAASTCLAERHVVGCGGRCTCGWRGGCSTFTKVGWLWLFGWLVGSFCVFVLVLVCCVCVCVCVCVYLV